MSLVKPISALFASLLCLAVLLASCQSKESSPPSLPTKETVAEVNQLLDQMADPPQIFNVSAAAPSKVRGEEGTVIHVDPAKLEALDGQPLGEQIKIELVEMTSLNDMVVHRAPTVSDGKMLETGGAYYLNMSSEDRPLKIKSEMGLEVEFPILTEKEMELFIGERDSLGQLNWVPKGETFERKELKKPEKPKKKKPQGSDMKDLMAFLGDSIPPTPEELAAYKKRKAQYELERKTYQALDISELGWFNCDRFFNDPRPKINISLLVTDESIRRVRFFAIFDRIKSVMRSNYYRDFPNLNDYTFQGIPEKSDLHLIGLCVLNQKPMLFEKKVSPTENLVLEVTFKEMTLEELQKWIAMRGLEA